MSAFQADGVGPIPTTRSMSINFETFEQFQSRYGLSSADFDNYPILKNPYVPQPGEAEASRLKQELDVLTAKVRELEKQKFDEAVAKAVAEKLNGGKPKFRSIDDPSETGLPPHEDSSVV